MRWMRRVIYSPYRYSVISDSFLVELTGGSITVRDRETQAVLKRHAGHKYLYTGDISPDEKECFALENGKHFYVYSLESLELVRRVTLPRGYESIDMYGHYSEDGAFIYIPASRWVGNEYLGQGYYEYVVCRYETENGTLVDKVVVDDWYKYQWNLGAFWAPQDTPDPDVEAIMKIILGDE